MAPREAAAQAIIDEDVAGIIATLGGALDELSGRTVLVTGASGMFGGYFADVFATLNRSARLDRPSSVYLATRHAPAPGGRLSHLVDREDVVVLTGEPWSHQRWPTHVDYLVHAASPASPRDYLADPVGTIDANSRYLRRLLEVARESHSTAVLYVSSSEVYGNPPPDAIPTPETYIGAVDPLSPRAAYAEAKRFGETLSMAFQRQHGVPVSIVRPFHVHGPGLRLSDGRIVAELIATGLRGERIQLLSDGTATRCYGYVADAVAAACLVLLRGAGKTYNIGIDAPETTILQLAGVVAELTDTPSPTASSEPPPAHLQGGQMRSRPDLTKLRSELAFTPRYQLVDGLSRTIEWHRLRSWAA